MRSASYSCADSTRQKINGKWTSGENKTIGEFSTSMQASLNPDVNLVMQMRLPLHLAIHEINL